MWTFIYSEFWTRKFCKLFQADYQNIWIWKIIQNIASLNRPGALPSLRRKEYEFRHYKCIPTTLLPLHTSTSAKNFSSHVLVTGKTQIVRRAVTKPRATPIRRDKVEEEVRRVASLISIRRVIPN